MRSVSRENGLRIEWRYTTLTPVSAIQKSKFSLIELCDGVSNTKSEKAQSKTALRYVSFLSTLVSIDDKKAAQIVLTKTKSGKEWTALHNGAAAATAPLDEHFGKRRSRRKSFASLTQFNIHPKVEFISRSSAGFSLY